MVKNFSKTIFGAVFFVVCAFFFSCGENSGLGATVDTESPKLGITYPPAGSIIRDKFVLGGTWSDDKTLRSISLDVYMPKTDGSKGSPVYSKLAEIDAKTGTWQTELNEYNEQTYASSNGWQFKDGNYVIDVTAYDNAGHSSGTSSVSVTIDNTAPVLVLKKPTSTELSNPKAYGRTVQLEGTFAEDCSTGISKLIVSFYDEHGEKLFDSEFEDITDMSNANPLVVAQYYDEGNEPPSTSDNYKKWSNYQKIYKNENISSYRDSNSDITEKIFFSVTTTDAAKIYNDFEGGTSVAGGNASKTFYRGTTEMLNLVSKNNTDFPDFSVAALKNFINKTDETYIESVPLAEILSVSESPSVNTESTASIAGTSDTYLTFSLNPKNNPNYTINGLSIKAAAESGDTENYTIGTDNCYYYNYYSDSTINISIAPGLDLTNIDTSTVSVFYTELGGTEKNLLWTWNKKVAVESAMSRFGISEAEAESRISADPSTYRYTPTSDDANTDQLSKSTTLSATVSPGEIVYGKQYRFSAEGKDINGQNLVESDSAGFGFYAKSNSAAPVVSFGEEDRSQFKNLQSLLSVKESAFVTDKLKFSGVTTSAAEITGMEYSLTLKDNSDSTRFVKVEHVALASGSDYTLKENTQYTYEWSFTFEPSSEMKAFVGSGLYNINVEVSATNGTPGTTSRSYYLDTVDPTISNVSISNGYKKNENLTYINNKRTFVLSGTTVDNYLIKSTTYKISGKDKDGNDKHVSGSSSESSWSSEELDLSGFVPQNGVADAVLEVTANDTAGNELTYTHDIEFDTTPPVGKHALDDEQKDLYFRIGSSNNDVIDSNSKDAQGKKIWNDDLDTDVGGKYKENTYGNATTIKIRGNFDDEGSGVNMVYYKVVKADSKMSYSELNAIAQDFLANYNKSNEKGYTGYFAPLSEAEQKRVFYNSTNGTISKKYIDSDDKIVVSTDENEIESDKTVVSIADGTTKYYTNVYSTFDSIISGFKEGLNYLLLVAEDKVGNYDLDRIIAKDFGDTDGDNDKEEYTVYTNSSINVDTDSPTLTCTWSGAHYTNCVTDLNIGGAVEDNASGVVSASITLKGEDINQNIIVNLVDSDSDGKKDSWTATISAKDNLSNLVSGKTYNVNATVTDAAGNSSASTIFTLQVDTEAPGVKMTTPVAGSTLNGTISVSGTVPAADIGATPAKLELYWSATAPVSTSTNVEGTNLSDLTKVGEITEASSIYSWTFASINTYAVFGNDTMTSRKDIYLIPVLYDEAGNCNVYKESLKENYESLDENEAITEKKYSYTEGTNFFKYTVDRNSDRPIINITSIDSEGDWLGNATLKGTITDDDGISAFYISTSSTFQESDKVTVSNGTWSYNLGMDGTKSLYFKVVDSQNKTFTTGDISNFARPYYLYSGTLASDYAGTTETPTYEYGLDNNAAIPVKLDTASPKMSTLGLTIGSNYNDYVVEGDNANLNGLYTVTQIAADTSASDKIFGSSRNAGGNSKYIRIYVPAYDSNISRVTVKIKDSDGNNQTDTFKTVNESTGTSSEITKITDTSGVDTTVITLTRTSINSSETVPDTTSEKFTYYESSVLDVSSVSTGTKTVEISVTDLAGNETKENKQFTVDNNGPDNITITSPAPTDEVTGTIKVVGTASDTGSGIDTIAWMVPPIAQKKAVTVKDPTASGYKSDEDLIVLSGWNETTTTGVFNFQFLSNSTTDLTLFEPSREDYADETKYNYAVTYNSDKQTFTIPLFIKTVDKLGNVFIKRDYSITHNPDADRPVTAMGYPTANDYDSGNNYKTLSGVIRVNGTVEIPSGTTTVGQVFIQIGKVTYDEAGKASVDWANYSTNFADEISDLGGVVRPVTTDGKTTITVPGANNSSTTYLNTSYVDSSWWGIPVTTKTSTWNVSLNSKSHLNPTESGSPRKIAIRACAINADGKMGLWTDSTIDPVYIHVDNGAPSQSAVMRQYQFGENEILSDANAENAEKISLQKDYTAEMYLKKTWYLVATLTDDESINSSSILVKQGSANKTSECVITGSGKTYKVYIPIETENMTSSYVNYTVSVDDNSTPAHSSTMTYNFSIDNDAPEISKVFRGASLAEDESNIISENEDIEDSNYIYTLAGKVNETGSGYDKVVFYYVRDGEKSAGGNYTTPAVLDPFITTNQNDAKAVIESDGLTTINVNGNSSIKLYGKSLTDGTTAAVPDTDGSYTFDQSSIAGNAHIRKGGLIYIGGEYGKITEKSGSKVTFTINASVVTTTTSAFFPYAQVVDNTGMETVSKQTGKDFEFSSQNEDDGMPETIEGSKAVGFTWTATMHTTNIPDGPAKLVILAFDKAGNVSQVSRNISIVNNRPRLAKVFLGTDLNSNNVWATDEFVGYNLYAANEGAGIAVTEVKEKQSIATANYDENSSPFQIKDKLAVISEFVGGNGEISMVYKKGAATTDAVPASGTGAGTVATANAAITSLIGTDDKVGSVTYHSNATSTSLMGFTLTSKEVAGLAANDALSAANGNVSGVNASFTFWDSTDEGASQSCVLQISDLTLALVDAASPKVVVNPFYWDSESSNSLYQNSRTNGHIELESDLTGTKAATLYGSDPKVSGKVTFTGTAYDDHTLKNLKFTLSRPVTANNTTTETAYTGFADVAMATYDPASTDAAYVENGGWSRLSGNSGSTVANGGKYEWTISPTSTTEEINARKYGDSCYLSQEGHKIYWTITIDTEQISDVAAKDVKLTVTATDKSNLASTDAIVTSSSPAAGKTDAKVNHVPVYQMDVVPYITKVYTRISKNAGEEFARSATGRYSLNQAETFRLFGFNLDKTTANNTVKTTVTFTADGATNGTALAVTLPENTDTEDKEILDNTALGSHIKVSAANITTKGSLKLTVNGVSSLNNDNAEPEFTENDKKAYNSQANGITNNLLNDDVKIYLWTTGVFDTVMRGHGANVTSPMMKFDPNGNYYISYGQGAKLFAINKNSTDTTLESCYNKYHNTNVAFDGSGNFYCVATDTDRIDTSTGGATSFTFFSRALGTSLHYAEQNGYYELEHNSHVHGNYYTGSNKRRLELSQYGGESNSDSDKGTYNINRVQRPKLTVSGNTSSAKVYMAYYDSSANNVKFRYGTVKGTESYDDWNRLQSQMTGGIANNLAGNGTDTGTNASSAAGYHLIATNSTTYKGGAYTAVGYASNGDAVVAWYDASNRQLVFSYNTAANIAKTTFWNGSPNTETRTAQAAWQDNAVVIDSDYAGWYVDLAVDSDNGVHIAYYKSSSGDLKYAYISKYNEAKTTAGKLDTSKVKVVTVDSYLSVGTNITINLKDKVPYIYYYNTSANQTTNSIKVAWQNGTLGNGAENDKFTGKWECMTIPTSNIPNDATVSGGVPTAGTYSGEVVLGYMTDLYFEKAELK